MCLHHYYPVGDTFLSKQQLFIVIQFLPDCTRSDVVPEVVFSFNDYMMLLCNCKYCIFIRYFLAYLYCGEYMSFIGSPLSLVNIIHLFQLTTTYCVVTAVETAIHFSNNCIQIGQINVYLFRESTGLYEIKLVYINCDIFHFIQRN